MLSAPSFRQLEQSMRTGDILLYNDSKRVCVAERRARQLGIARRLAAFLSALPCNTFVGIVPLGAAVHVDGSDLSYSDGEWTDWDHAALVVRLVDETETNPSKDKTVQIPYVLHPQEPFALIPARALLESVGARVCAWRQLLIRSDELARAGNLVDRTRCSRVRDTLRDHVLNFYRDVVAAERMKPRSGDWHHVSTLINEPTERLRSTGALIIPKAAIAERLPLFYASPSYFTAHTLFHVHVLRNQTSTSAAQHFLQENGPVQSAMAHDYVLADPIVFEFSKGKPLRMSAESE